MIPVVALDVWDEVTVWRRCVTWFNHRTGDSWGWTPDRGVERCY